MHKKNALKEVKMPLGVSPLTELRVFIDWLLRPYSTAQKEEKLLKNKPVRFSHIVPSLVQICEHGIWVLLLFGGVFFIFTELRKFLLNYCVFIELHKKKTAHWESADWNWKVL